MADKIIRVRHQLYGDTLQNLQSKNPVLLNHEPVFVFVSEGDNSGFNEPTVLLKTGDGSTAFNDLPYVAAVAGDVPAWAKDTEKPVYSATEISGLSDYISENVKNGNTQYQLEQDTDNPHIVTLLEKAADAENWTAITSITTVDTVYDDSGLTNRVTALEENIENISVPAGISEEIEELKTNKADKATTLAGYGITDGMTSMEIETAIQSAVASSAFPSFLESDDIPSADTAEDGVFYLVYNSQSGKYDIYAKIENAIIGLGSTDVDLTSKVDKESGKRLMTDEEGLKLADIEEEAQKNVIESIQINGTTQSVSNKTVNLPGATLTALGLVKSASGENCISVNSDFTMNVYSLNANRLVQSDGDSLILNCGTAGTN